MKGELYVLDTHALVFWFTRQSVSDEFIKYFDNQDSLGHLYISSIAFWEIALLVKKGKLKIDDIQSWKNDLFAHSNLLLMEPSASEMIDSVQLPDYHKDPFDRLLVAQAKSNNLTIVTRDKFISEYEVPVFWI
ncbi:type II toxin-antitoxin system VapC family toxin [candidate division KSB1 bacterium]|nr:type II toxin-antitoxin system VapC family toxin [candidate division KSB1 bacterium]